MNRRRCEWVHAAQLCGSRWALPVVTLAAFATPTSAQYVYFTNQTTVQRVPLAGGDIETLVKDQIWPLALALDVENGKVYWTDASVPQILRANLDGSEVETLVSTGISFPAGLALDLEGGKMYWGDRDFPGVSRANLDGTDVELLVPGVNALGVALNLREGKVYWTEEQFRVGRAELDGSGAETVLGELGSPNAIALDVDADMLYVTDENPSKIVRASLDGVGMEVVVTADGINPFGITLDTAGGKMYWTDIATGISRRANLDGTEAEDLFPAAWSFGIALDGQDFQQNFIRGDSDANGKTQITDAIYTLNSLFLGGPQSKCLDAADADDNGTVSLTDAVHVLNYLFLEGNAPPAPGPDVCGSDPTPDSLPGCTLDRTACGRP